MSSPDERARTLAGRIETAARAAGRDPTTVRLVAASKTRTVAEIVAAARTGAVHAFGENRVQEALPKMAATPGEGLRWHFIGGLQRNKVKDLGGFELVHSVSSAALVDAIAERVPAVPVLVQVNMGFEARKGGVAVDAAGETVHHCLVRGVHVEGLMTMAPRGDREAARRCFAGLRALRDEISHDLGVALPELSMGMTEDFEIAIAEGATLVRVGRALFGDRPPPRRTTG